VLLPLLTNFFFFLARQQGKKMQDHYLVCQMYITTTRMACASLMNTVTTPLSGCISKVSVTQGNLTTCSPFAPESNDARMSVMDRLLAMHARNPCATRHGREAVSQMAAWVNIQYLEISQTILTSRM
jgi:hypothetical protein